MAGNKNKKNNNNTTAGQTSNEANNVKHSEISAQLRKELDKLAVSLFEMGYKQTMNTKEEWQQYIDMQKTLNRVREIEAPLRPFNVEGSRETRLQKIDAFSKWATENGVHADALKVNEFPGYQLGLQATRNIVKGEEVLSIPRKLIFTEEQLGKNIDNLGPMTNLNLAYALMVETMKSKSLWKPYIDILPDKYNTVLYFTVEEMSELRGSNALSCALRQCKLIARQYAYMYKCAHLCGDFGNVTNVGLQFQERFCYDLYRFS